MDSYEAGFEFPKLSFQLTQPIVDEYRQAVGAEPAAGDFVPPLAVAAFAMKTMTESTFFQPGSVHASQDFEFFRPVAIGSTISCSARIAQSIKRTGLDMLTVEIRAFDSENHEVLNGKATIIIPSQSK
jgi:acyl dehydratase